jgi:two-component system phosphate regulon response regulator OmpR
MEKTGQNTRRMADLPHVLIVDDDDRIRELVSRFLGENGFVTAAAASAAEAREALRYLLFDALVVDIMMPGETGLDFIRTLRGDGRAIPALLLTALGETEDRITGFESGADDYLPKPFEPRELVVRLQSLLRRGGRSAGRAADKPFTIGRWTYDPDHKELTAGGETVKLTAVEANLLEGLARRAGEVVSREDLALLTGIEANERTIDVQVTRLRRKLEDDSKNPRWLQTVRGKGYLLRTGEA